MQSPTSVSYSPPPPSFSPPPSASSKMTLKDKLNQTKKAIATTASKTADKTKSAIQNAQLKEKTMTAMANIREKTVEAKNAMVEKTKDMRLKTSTDKYRNVDDETGGEGQTQTALVGSPPPPAHDGASNYEATRVFGVPLETACQHAHTYHPFIPDVLFQCFSYLYEKGTMEEGIFRLSGSTSAIQQMKASFDQGLVVDLNECYDPHAISGLLKLFLRELPESIVPKQVSSGPEKMASLKQKIDELPPINRCILANLMRLLQQISVNESTTKMTVNNLVIIFVPTLACSSDLTYLMITNAHEVFAYEPVVSFSLLASSIGQDARYEDDLIVF